MEEESKNSILILNDDCLLNIFSYLPFWNQIEVAYVCRRFRQIVGEIFKKDPILDVHKVIKSNQIFYNLIYKIVQVIGQYKTHIYHRYSQIDVAFLIESCPNLVYLDLYYIPFKLDSLFKDTGKVFQKLKTLSITCCKITDNELRYLAGNPVLEELILSGNKSLIGQNLSDLKSLQRVTISSSDKFTSDSFCKLFSGIESLKYLNIEYSVGVDEKSFEILAQKHGKSLETLFIDSTHLESIKIDKFTSLKSVSVSPLDDGYDIPTEFLQGLACSKIETLSFEQGNTDTEVTRYLVMMPSLKNLAFKYCVGFGGCVMRILTESSLNLTHFDCSQSPLSDRCIINYIIAKKDVIEEINVRNCRELSADFLPKLLSELKRVNREKILKIHVSQRIGDVVESYSSSSLFPLELVVV